MYVRISSSVTSSRLVSVGQSPKEPLPICLSRHIASLVEIARAVEDTACRATERSLSKSYACSG